MSGPRRAAGGGTSGQRSLFDLDDSAPPPAVARAPARPPAGLPRWPGPHTVFFASCPDPDEAAGVHEAALREERRLDVGGKPLEPERLHVSLHLVAEYTGARPDADVERWLDAAARLRVAPFELVFDRAASFGGGRNPLVLLPDTASAAAMRRLWRELGIVLADAGEDVQAGAFAPHMTVSYRGRRVPETPIEPVRWTARELVLIDSHVGAHRYETLGAWALHR